MLFLTQFCHSLLLYTMKQLTLVSFIGLVFMNFVPFLSKVDSSLLPSEQCGVGAGVGVGIQ